MNVLKPLIEIAFVSIINNGLVSDIKVTYNLKAILYN